MATNADGSIVIETILDNNGFNRNVDSMKNKVGSLKSAVGKLGKAIASAFAVKAVVDFGKECIELGSNISEVQNVVDTSFGEMTYKVEAFADSAIQNFGMSRLAAKKTASTYMAMAKGMGLNEETASDMAISLAGLTGDVASFYNISQELADVKLKSVFTGETESLKDLGVVMTQTNLKAYALKQGITKDISAMSQAEQVALRYGFVMESLSLAQGDFAKTSDSWANQTRILSMQWQEFMSVIGQALITILTPCLQALNQIVSTLVSAASAFSAFVSSVFGGEQKAAEGVSEHISESVSQQEALTDETKETAKEQKKALAGFDEISKLSGSEADSEAAAAVDIGGIGSTVAAAEEVEQSGAISYLERMKDAVAPFRNAFLGAIEDIKVGFIRIKETFANIWSDIGTLVAPLKAWATGPLIELINAVVSTVGNFVGGVLDSVGMVLGDLWSVIVFPSLQKLITDILPAVTQFKVEVLSTFNVLFNEVKIIFDRIWQEAVVPALSIIQSVWEGVWDGILTAWNNHGAPIFDKLREAIQGTSDFFQNIWDTIILPIWQHFMDVVDNLWTNHLKPLWDNFMDFVGLLIEGALDIYNGFILPMYNWFVKKFGGNIVNAFNDTISKIGEFLGVIADVASYVVDALKGVIDFVVGVFTGDWERAWNGLSAVFKGVVNGLITIAEYFCNYFVRAINKVILAANSLHFDIPDWIPGVGGKTFGLSIPTISEIRLPRLATGSVVPPNREFMAVLGDNKTETEVVSPLSTMKQAMMEALRESGSAGKETTIVFNGEMAALARVLRPYIEEEGRRVGVALVTR